jgi:peptidoglycan hydrolase-like protein with peptidoglycan-binding domain
MITPAKHVLLVAGLLGLGSTMVLADSMDNMRYNNTGTFSQFSSSYRDPQQMLTSDNIRQVQQALAEQGYYEGAVDGKWGVRSQAAMRTFQQAQGNRPTGMITGAALDSLGIQVSDKTRAAMDEADVTIRRNMRSNEH